MPECHTCPFNNRHSRHCLTCAGPSEHPPHHGLSFIPLSRLSEKELVALQSPDPEPEHPVAEFIRYWVRLPPHTREMLARVLVEGNSNLAAIARDLNVTRQAIHSHVKKVMALFPELQSVLARRKQQSQPP